MAIAKSNGKVATQNFDLEERTSMFGESVIKLALTIPVSPVTEPLIKHFVNAGTSVGQLRRSQRRRIQKGLPPQNRDLPERIERVQVLAPNVGRRRPATPR